MEKITPQNQDRDPFTRTIAYSFGGRAALAFILVFIVVTKNLVAGGITILFLLPIILLAVYLGGKVLWTEINRSRKSAVFVSTATFAGILIVLLGASFLKLL
jgi:hypothetical protein